jgi:uncharacterized protein YbjT (DUF2867 family)
VAKVLVTGGTGTLGRLLVPRLSSDTPIRLLTRRTLPETDDHVRYVRGDLVSGNGLMEATHSVDVIVHCASNPSRKAWKTDVEGTRRLLKATQWAHARPHVIYISIVGVDRHPLKYYRAKRAAEQLIESSGLPFTILRTTQWYELIAWALGRLTKAGVTFLPKDFRFQPLAASEVATRIARLASAKPAGLLPDMAGPRVRTIDDLAVPWAAATNHHLRTVHFPVPGKAGKAFREGLNLSPERAVGRTSWESWLSKNVSDRRPMAD